MSQTTAAKEEPKGASPVTEAVPFPARLEAVKDRVETRLEQLLPAAGEPSLAARLSLLAPAKRLRAVLTVITAEQCGASEDCALDVACAIEMVHTASLIFDDLPAMDDADMRRGMPTPHKVYGDGVAILAGIGLLNGAFGVVAQVQSLSAAQRVEVVEVLSRAIGWSGLVQGQALDLRPSEGTDLDDIHYGKTGALFVAAVLAGAACAGAPLSARTALGSYGRALGLAYQAMDDVLDQVAAPQETGKCTGKDGGKLTAVSGGERYPIGLAAAKTKAARHLDEARAAAREACPGSALIALTEHIAAHFERLSA